MGPRRRSPTSIADEPINFYAIVEVLDSPATRALGIVGKIGVVTGVPPADLGLESTSESGDPAQAQYAVDIDDEGYAVALRDLRPVG